MCGGDSFLTAATWALSRHSSSISADIADIPFDALLAYGTLSLWMILPDL